MAKQYPHFLFRKIVRPSVQDPDGNWSEAGEEWVFHSMCREETNGKGTLIQLTDGKMIAFSSLIQCPKGTPAIDEGSTIQVCDHKDLSDHRIMSKVMKSSVDQLHTRIWV